LSARKASRTALFAASAGSGLLALGSKEIAATLPCFMFLYEWYFFQDLDAAWLRKRLPLLAAVCALTAAIAMVYLRGADPLERIAAPYQESGHSMAGRVLTQLRVVVFYLSLLFWPHPSRLNLDHDFPLSRSLTDPLTTLGALALLSALAAAAVVAGRRHRLASYAILWFLGNLAIESSVIHLEIVFEHRTYLPSVMPAAALVFWVAEKLPSRRAAAAILCAAALPLGLWTYQRNLVWADEVALWRDCLEKSPGKARPYNNLGSALARRDRIEEAVPYFKKATEINPDYESAYYNLGYSYLRMGDTDGGIAFLNKALALEPRDPMALNNLGAAYLMKEDYERAVACLEAALRVDPDLESAHNNLGVALKNQGRIEEALKHYSEAIRINPNYAEAHNNLGVALKESGRLAEAAVRFRRALQIQPGYPAALKNLEETEALLGGKK
jgi:Flp pilus assembly protein TadD